VGLDELRNDIYTSRPDGSAVRRLTFRGWNGSPEWAPSGRRIVFDRDGDIWTMRANGRQKHRVIAGPSQNWGPAWAPHGRRIVFVRGVDDDPHLVVYSLLTGTSRRLAGNYTRPSSPAWSPNGRSIMFSGTPRGDSETLDLYTISPEGNGLRNLTATPRVWETGPDWSPNGRRVVYVHEGRGCRSLHTMKANGTDDRRVPRSCPAEHPAWSPNGSRITFNPRPEIMGARVWSMSLNGSHKRFVTRGHGPDWQPKLLGR
jgi:TolB protein